MSLSDIFLMVSGLVFFVSFWVAIFMIFNPTVRSIPENDVLTQWKTAISKYQKREVVNE